MRKIYLPALLVMTLTFSAAACTVQTEDDSVPGNGHGWAGLYYYFTPYTGTVEDGLERPFEEGTSAASHSLILEGTVGFQDNFYGKIDVPYSVNIAETTGGSDTESGFGDVFVAAKWVFLNNSSGPRAGLLVGAALPTGDEETGFGGGVFAPKVMAVGGVGAGPGRLYGGASYNYIPAKEGTDAGDVMSYHVTYDVFLGRGFTVPIETFGYVQSKDKVGGAENAASGSQYLFGSPCVTYTFLKNYTVCGGVIVPVLKEGYGDDFDYQPHVTFFFSF